MTFYLIVWLGYSCPLGLGGLPMQLKAAICSPALQYEWTSYRGVAERRLLELGPQTKSAWLEIKSGRLSERQVSWTPAIR